ncbi:uncharacterized protein DEA37_0003033 [Paragonimus westermani]|uniref:ZP domain-containing protein n=1 Tax=Paragonimus westermani TaxID=34504 RepID=A0A5J4NTE2_9TREM|nr:uncharacterized protein DEA37_0003033 [Paragonimus westermani]
MFSCLICAYLLAPYTPELVCEHEKARIRYDKKYNKDLNTSMIKLIGDIPISCQFKVLETEAFIEAIVPLEGCGGSLSLSNESTIAIKLKVIREYLASESEIITNLPVQFEVTCLIPRVNHIQPGTLVSPELVSTLSGDSQQTEASLQLYSDAGFSSKLPEGNTIRPGEQVNALVSVKNPPSATKLILEDCWATANADRQSRPRVDLIVNRLVKYFPLRLSVGIV